MRPITVKMFEARLVQGNLLKKVRILSQSLLVFSYLILFSRNDTPKMSKLPQFVLKVLESLKDLLNEATWDCSDTGIQLQVNDRKLSHLKHVHRNEFESEFVDGAI